MAALDDQRRAAGPSYGGPMVTHKFDPPVTCYANIQYVFDERLKTIRPADSNAAVAHLAAAIDALNRKLESL